MTEIGTKAFLLHCRWISLTRKGVEEHGPWRNGTCWIRSDRDVPLRV